MIDLPPLWLPAAPAIIRAAEPWETQMHGDLIRRGVPRNVRRAVVAEVKRLAGVRPLVIKPAIDDLAKYAGIDRAAFPFPAFIPFSGPPKILTFQAHPISGSNLTTYTFSTVGIGTATADRRVIVGATAGASGAGTLSSLTVGGVTAGIVVTSSNGTQLAGIAIADVPSGTTGDIVVTWSRAASRCGIGVWICTGLSSQTAHASNTSTANDGVLTNLATTVGGFIVAVCACSGTSPSFTSWTNVTFRYEEDVETNNGWHAGGDTTTDGSAVTVTAAYTTTTATNTILHGASW
jgi:hypothetical protein